MKFEKPARRMKPTLKHRPAIWSGLLGTVYALNRHGEAKYFDYNYHAAWEWADILRPECDLRIWKVKDNTRWVVCGPETPRPGVEVIWTRDDA